MTDSSIGRYLNLVRYIRNWNQYFRQKRAQSFSSVRFVTRGNSLIFDVPTRELYLVFKEIFMTDFYSVKKWISQLPANPIIVDVGANAGFFDTLLLSQKSDARIYAYEPIEKNVALFSANLSLNPSVKGNVNLFHRAVTGKSVEFVELYKEADSDNSVTASVFPDFETHNLKSVKVRAISLSQIMSENKLDHIDFLKLDCEGSEYPIIYDSPPDIWKKINSIFLEVHNLDKEMRNFDALNNFIMAAGYKTSSEIARNGCYALYARR
ncbi:MAG TPA: FkbM family methyltransferase [Cyclobacteriaceae bacterium]|nr:FkbM family methyltransferase [Cyclobacteriaceae bacterium]